MKTPAKELSPGFRTFSPRSLAPFVFTCEHATNRLPHRVRDAQIQDLLRSHWGWDIGAWSLARELARRARATAIRGRWSRLLIDLNRLVSDPTLIRHRAGGLDLPWNRSLTRRQIEGRILEIHSDYHNELDRLIIRHLVRDLRPALIAVHSFTPEEFDGRSRRFDVGVLFNSQTRLAHRVGKSLRDGGLRVRYNEPYSGIAGMMYSADRHGTHHGLDFLELEFNQILFEEADAVERLAGITVKALNRIGSGAR